MTSLGSTPVSSKQSMAFLGMYIHQPHLMTFMFVSLSLQSSRLNQANFTYNKTVICVFPSFLSACSSRSCSDTRKASSSECGFFVVYAIGGGHLLLGVSPVLCSTVSVCLSVCLHIHFCGLLSYLLLCHRCTFLFKKYVFYHILCLCVSMCK